MPVSFWGKNEIRGGDQGRERCSVLSAGALDMGCGPVQAEGTAGNVSDRAFVVCVRVMVEGRMLTKAPEGIRGGACKE